MDTLTELLGTPSLPAAIITAALLWVAVRVIEMGVDAYANRAGWTVTADPAELVRLDEVIDRLDALLEVATADRAEDDRTEASV